MPADQPIVPGISVSASGQATIDPSVTEVLFDLAESLEDATKLPVDVQHVVAALVLASREGKLDPSAVMAADDAELVSVLAPRVKLVFRKFGGVVGSDE